jgi:hypothetical protein
LPTDDSGAEKIEAYDGSGASDSEAADPDHVLTSEVEEPAPNPEYIEMGSVKKGKGKRALSTEHAMPKRDTDDDIDMDHSENEPPSKRKRAPSKPM